MQEFDWLFRDEYPGVLRSVFLVVRDRGRAEEITQDAFTTLYRHWRRVSMYERPDAWVRRVALRLAIRQASRERRRPAMESKVLPNEVPNDRDMDLAAAIAALPPVQRACLVLTYFEDRPSDEVADILRIAPSTVRVHLTRARRTLAEALHEEVPDDAA